MLIKISHYIFFLLTLLLFIVTVGIGMGYGKKMNSDFLYLLSILLLPLISYIYPILKRDVSNIFQTNTTSFVLRLFLFVVLIGGFQFVLNDILISLFLGIGFFLVLFRVSIQVSFLFALIFFLYSIIFHMIADTEKSILFFQNGIYFVVLGFFLEIYYFYIPKADTGSE